MKYLFSVLLLFIWGNCFSQFQNIVLDEADGIIFPQYEASIAINPEKNDNIVAAGLLDKIYVTKNGGKSWVKKQIKSSFGTYGNPVVISDKKGNFYFFHLSGPAETNLESDEFLDRIVVHKSKDEGLQWEETSFVGYNPPKDQINQAVTTDKKGNLYLAWTQFDKSVSKDPADESNILFSSSTNRGKKWSDPLQINKLSGNSVDNEKVTAGAMPAVTLDGRIYVTWVFDNTIFLDRSYDGGEIWLQNDILVTDISGGRKVPGLKRSNSKPVLVADKSSTVLQGLLHLNWSDQTNGENDTDIWFTSSHNGGDIWTPRIRVNDDAPGKHQFMSWMSQDPKTGFLYVIFYDRRNYDDNNTDVYLAYSKNGGRSFTNVKISESPFIPDKDHVFDGYTNIDAYDGTIVPVWTRTDNDKTRIVTAVIKQEELDKLEGQQ